MVVGSGGTFHAADEQRQTLECILVNAGSAMMDPTLDNYRARLANICFEPSTVADEVLLAQLTSYALGDRFDALKAVLGG